MLWATVVSIHYTHPFAPIYAAIFRVRGDIKRDCRCHDGEEKASASLM